MRCKLLRVALTTIMRDLIKKINKHKSFIFFNNNMNVPKENIKIYYESQPFVG